MQPKWRPPDPVRARIRTLHDGHLTTIRNGLAATCPKRLPVVRSPGQHVALRLPDTGYEAALSTP